MGQQWAAIIGVDVYKSMGKQWATKLLMVVNVY